MSFRPLPTRRQAILVCAFVVLTALVCAGLVSAAALAPAPPGVVPLVVAVCVCCPIVAAWELPVSVAVLRATGRPDGTEAALDGRALAALRRRLDELPETQHPLGL
jgi:hypothetical protein